MTIDQANCPNNIFLESQCICGASPQQTGYCCNGEWSALPCGILEVEDTEPEEEEENAEGDEGSEGESEDQEDIEDIALPDDSGGCQSVTPTTHGTGLALIRLWTRFALRKRVG